jgi:uncharacterized membrane protein YdcZ (DUF606 family)
LLLLHELSFIVFVVDQEIIVHAKQIHMSWLRGLLAGAAAWKWGGGCFGTILVFVIVYWLLGQVGC